MFGINLIQFLDLKQISNTVDKIKFIKTKSLYDSILKFRKILLEKDSNLNIQITYPINAVLSKISKNKRSLMKNEKYLYILELRNNKYYVGTTSNLRSAIANQINGFGAKWTRIHEPIKLIDVIYTTSITDKKDYTLFYMKKYGWENVRGSNWCNVEMKNPPKELRRKIKKTPKKRVKNKNSKIKLTKINKVITDDRLILNLEYEDPQYKNKLQQINRDLPLKIGEEYVYVLKLENNNYYIGATKNIPMITWIFKNRREKIFKNNKPIEIIELYATSNANVKNNVADNYINEYGKNHVFSYKRHKKIIKNKNKLDDLMEDIEMIGPSERIEVNLEFTNPNYKEILNDLKNIKLPLNRNLDEYYLAVIELEDNKIAVKPMKYISYITAVLKGQRQINWSRLYKPIKLIEISKFSKSNEQYVNDVTLDYINKYGSENVRGGKYQ